MAQRYSFAPVDVFRQEQYVYTVDEPQCFGHWVWFAWDDSPANPGSVATLGWRLGTSSKAQQVVGVGPQDSPVGWCGWVPWPGFQLTVRNDGPPGPGLLRARLTVRPIEEGRDVPPGQPLALTRRETVTVPGGGAPPSLLTPPEGATHVRVAPGPLVGLLRVALAQDANVAELSTMSAGATVYGDRQTFPWVPLSPGEQVLLDNSDPNPIDVVLLYRVPLAVPFPWGS